MQMQFRMSTYRAAVYEMVLGYIILYIILNCIFCFSEEGREYMLNNEETKNLAEECKEMLGTGDYTTGVACLGLLALKWLAKKFPPPATQSRWREMVENVGYNHEIDVEEAVLEVFAKNNIDNLYEWSNIIYGAKLELQNENKRDKEENRMSKIPMREALYEIDQAFDRFSDLLYNTDALIQMVEKIENIQNGGPDEEICMVAAAIKYYLEHIRKDMGQIYTDVDLALLRTDRENMGRVELVPITPAEEDDD